MHGNSFLLFVQYSAQTRRGSDAYVPITHRHKRTSPATEAASFPINMPITCAGISALPLGLDDLNYLSCLEGIHRHAEPRHQPQMLMSAKKKKKIMTGADDTSNTLAGVYVAI